MQLWRRSIQWQLILSMGTALLVSILIVVGIYTLVVNRLAQSYLVEQALPSSIEATRNDIERILVQPLTAAKDIASNSMVRDWLASGEDSSKTAAFAQYLEGIRAEHKAFTALIIGTDSNHYITEKGLDRTLSRTKPADAWFYSFLDSNQPRTLNIDNDGATGELALFIDLKVEQAGKVVGVAGLGLSMKELSELIHNFSFGERGKVYLVRSDGLIQVHPEAQFSGKRTLTEQIGASAAQAVMGQKLPPTARSSAMAKTSWPSACRCAIWAGPWWPKCRSRRSTPKPAAMWMSGGIGLAVALVCLLLVVWLARGLVRPIRQVTAALVAIGSGGGDLTHRLDSSRADELGDLARGFNRFLDSQRNMIGEVLTTSERLRTAVGQVARVVDNTAERSGRQQEMTDMVATAVHEMGLTVQEIAQNAGNAAVASQTARDEALQAREVVAVDPAYRKHVR
jgi:methyl-accepting chemotaxis protein